MLAALFNRSSSSWIVPLAGIGFAVLLLVAALFSNQQRLGLELRRQLADREGFVVSSMLQRQLASGAGTNRTDPLLAIVETSAQADLPGVRGVHLLRADGAFITTVLGRDAPVPPTSEAMAAISAGGVVSRFLPPADDRPPILEIISPIRRDDGEDLLGLVVFELDGTGLAEEYRRLDAKLWNQARWTLAAAGSSMTLILALAFWRLTTANRLLADRSRQLLQANHDLAMAAKTSAVGAVAAHLVHGLKNPLAALQSFLAARPVGDVDSNADWSDATLSARRMKSMIDEVVRVLRDEQSGLTYELTCDEMAGLLRRRVAPLAEVRNVPVEVQCTARVVLVHRLASLSLLILENLLANAIQASPPGKPVECVMQMSEDTLECRVRDQGGGLPVDVRQNLFSPVLSSKPGGTGLGLAISRQLALHVGAVLELESTSAAGSVFVLRLPGVAPHGRHAG